MAFPYELFAVRPRTARNLPQIRSHFGRTVSFDRLIGGVAADRALGWLLQHLNVCAVGRGELERARSLGWSDFEDAVVAAVAERAGCDCIVTRNVKDFEESPVTVLTPQEWLLR